MKNSMNRDKWFFVGDWFFNGEWPFKNREALGMNFEDFTAMKVPVLRFNIKGETYEIDRNKAIKLGTKWKLPQGFKLPNLIPKEEFKRVERNTLFQKSEEEKIKEMAQQGVFG